MSFVKVSLALALAVGSAPAFAKKDAKPVANEARSAQAEFARIAAKVAAAREDAKKDPKGGGSPVLAVSTAKSLAGEYKSFAKDFRAAAGYYNAGALYEEAGDPKAAEDAYKAALEMDEKFGCGHAGLGGLAYAAGDAQRASQEFDTALRLDPKCVQGYYGSALTLFDRGKATGDTGVYKEAIGKLRRALAVDSESVQAYSLLALIYYTIAESDRSKLDLAELVCKQAKEVNDHYPQIYNTLGLIKLRKKDVSGALKEFKTAAQYDTGYTEAQLNIGAITLSVRDYKTAETAFKAALDSKPRDPKQQFDATIGMGVALRGQRRVDEAEKWYVAAKQLDPKSCVVSYNLGVLYQDYKAGGEPDLNKAKGLFQEFASCGRSEKDKLADATRRVKDIDDTFKAIQEQKKIEEENKKMQAEVEEMQKKQEEQMKQQQQPEQPPPPKGAPETPSGTPVKPVSAKGK